MSLEQLANLVKNPLPNAWHNSLQLSSSGLYLIGVHFDSEGKMLQHSLQVAYNLITFIAFCSDQSFGTTKPPIPLEEDDFDLNFVPEPVDVESDAKLESN